MSTSITAQATRAQCRALDQVADVVAVMDAAGVGSAVAVGLSRGAITAYGLAVTQPDRMHCLVLAFPVAGFADTLAIDAEAPSRVDSGGESMLMEIAGQVFSPSFLEAHLDEAISLLTTSPGSVARVDRSAETPLSEGFVVDCPVLIVEGGADAVVGPEHPARNRRAHPDAHHVSIHGAYHGWIMEDPETFATVVDSFVEVGSPGSG